MKQKTNLLGQNDHWRLLLFIYFGGCFKNTDSQGALPQGLIHGCGGTWVFIFTSVPGDYKPASVGAGVWKLLLLTISFNRSNLSLMGHHELKNCVVSISSSSVIPPLPASSFRIP